LLKLLKNSALALLLSSSIANADIISMIKSVNDKHFHLPQSLVLGTAQVESRLNCKVTGRAGEQGLFQIKPQTARGMGFSSGSLYNCETNAYYGLKHLSLAYAKCGTVLGAAKLHNAGLAASCSPSSYSYKVQRAGIAMARHNGIDNMATGSITKPKTDDVMDYLMNKDN
jgi:soluble lytic murein transglycosylase-like protein